MTSIIKGNTLDKYKYTKQIDGACHNDGDIFCSLNTLEYNLTKETQNIASGLKLPKSS